MKDNTHLLNRSTMKWEESLVGDLVPISLLPFDRLHYIKMLVLNNPEKVSWNDYSSKEWTDVLDEEIALRKKERYLYQNRILDVFLLEAIKMTSKCERKELVKSIRKLII